MFLVDSHCHLDKLNYKNLHKNLPDVLEKSRQSDVKFFLSVTTSISSYKKIKKLIGLIKNIAYTFGIHPLYCEEKHNFTELEMLASDPKVIAVGETGLDYQQNTVEKNKKNQKELFRAHITFAKFLKKPIIIHCRNAASDILKMLYEEKYENLGGILHCCTENKQIVKKMLDLGFYISFSGIITFKNACSVRDVARFVPLDRILIETDSPYLAPAPYRGKENQPAWITEVAKTLSIIKNINTNNLADVTTKNFFTLFKQLQRDIINIYE